MKLLHKLTSLTGMIALCMSLCSCSSDNGRETALTISDFSGFENYSSLPDLSDEDFSDYTIGVSFANCTANTYNNAYLQAFNEYADSLGVETKVFDSYGDSTQQASQIKTLISMEPDLILLWPINSDTAVTWVKNINEAEIPVFSVNTNVSSAGEQYLEGYIGPSNYDEAYMTATQMAEDLKGSGSVIFMSGMSDYAPVQERELGFNKAISGTKIQVLEQYDDQGTQSIAKGYMKDCLKTYAIGEISAVFCYDDASAGGVITAMQEADRLDDFPIYIAATGNYSTLSYIEDGIVRATAIQSPIVDARSTLNYALQYLLGTKNDDFYTYIDTPLVTSDNVDSLNITSWNS